ncbi:hypothetical protein GCM10009663_77100 [Kitasatospora arboriphila]|uniref:Uncharacterized protein n=1 Tax=Kitasatospora arboriphila TaxID=258052 RepID=A0ABP4ERY4_9ACTN
MPVAPRVPVATVRVRVPVHPVPVVPRVRAATVRVRVPVHPVPVVPRVPVARVRVVPVPVLRVPVALRVRTGCPVPPRRVPVARAPRACPVPTPA